jgi:hypothetical protein
MYRDDKSFLTSKTAHRASDPLPLTLCTLCKMVFGYYGHRQCQFEIMMEETYEKWPVDAGPRKKHSPTSSLLWISRSFRFTVNTKQSTSFSSL